MNIRDDSFVEVEETFGVTLRRFIGGFDPFRGGASEGELSEVLSVGVVTIQDDDCMFSMDLQNSVPPPVGVEGVAAKPYYACPEGYLGPQLEMPSLGCSQIMETAISK